MNIPYDPPDDMIEGQISTDLPKGNYYITYYNNGYDKINVKTNIDLTYETCIENCN